MDQAIVVRNEFTNKFHEGHGKTPGHFVLNYIARKGATETMTPLSVDLLTEPLTRFVTRYMARQDATEQAISEYAPLRQLAVKLDRIDGLNGRGFGSDGLSYSGSELTTAAMKIQQLYDQGHSIYKLVVSFKTDYLKDRGILPPDFQYTGRGSYKGEVDQLKLRSALNDGMTALTQQGQFENPLWVGSVQVDASHVHAHIVVGDDIPLEASKRLVPTADGHLEDKGKLSSAERSACRKELNYSLLGKKAMRSLHAQVDLSRTNMLTNLRQLALDQTTTNAKLQEIVASLPKDQTMWRYGSHAKVMRRPNQLMRDYLTELVQSHGELIGYPDTLQAISHYSRQRKADMGLSDAEEKQVYQHGVSQVQTRMANAVYGQLRQQVRAHDLTVKTPFILQQAQDPDELRARIVDGYRHGHTDPDLALALFSYRVSGYRERLNEHMERTDYYHALITDFDQVDSRHGVADSARVMRTFYQTQQQTHAGLVDKYRYFFKLDGAKDDQVIASLQPQVTYLTRERQQVVQVGQQEGVLVGQHGDRNQQTQQMARQLLQDQRLQPVMALAAQQTGQILQPGEDVMTIGQLLAQVSQGQPAVLPADTVTALNVVGERLPEYAQIGTRLADNQYQLPPDSARFDDTLQQYLGDTVQFSYQAFERGVLRADQLIDQQTAKRQVQQLGSADAIPVVPSLHPRQVGITPAYFDQVKGLDLDAVLYDFDPETPRDVSPLAQHTFHHSVDKQIETADDAQDYLRNTQQPDTSVQQLLNILNARRLLSHQIEATGKLPFDDDYAAALALERQRQLASISLDQANLYTEDHVKLLQADNQAFTHELETQTTKTPDTAKTPDDDVASPSINLAGSTSRDIER